MKQGRWPMRCPLIICLLKNFKKIDNKKSPMLKYELHENHPLFSINHVTIFLIFKIENSALLVKYSQGFKIMFSDIETY